MRRKNLLSRTLVSKEWRAWYLPVFRRSSGARRAADKRTVRREVAREVSYL